MNEDSMKASSDLIRWLKMLALPAWARFALASIMLLILCSALGLLVWGLSYSQHETISSAVTMLTVGLPVGLIVVALIFGDGGARKLKTLTEVVLTKEVPQAILENLRSHAHASQSSEADIETKVRGCIAQDMERYQSCFFGASKEGYIQNQALLLNERKGFTGLVFIKTLGDDFLLDSAQRLYFTQDLAFFIRGLLSVEASHG